MKLAEYNENKSHGTEGFPIELYRVDKNKSYYVMQLHWHSHIELVRVLSGQLYLYINGAEQVMHAGDVAVVGGRMLHRADPVDCEYECIVCDLSMLRRRSDDVSRYITPLISGGYGVKEIGRTDLSYAAVHRLFDCMEREGRCYELAVTSCLFDLLYLLNTENKLDLSVENERTRGRTNAIYRLIDWIDDNFTEQVTLSDMAKVCGLSEKYICKLFKELTGYTPIGYVNRMRIQNACYEMTAGEMTVTEAAVASGFNEMSYFTRTFKRYLGVSPREYRKNNACIRTDGVV